MTMNNLPNISLNFSNQECGLTYQVELNLSVFFPKLQELCGIDLQPIVIPLLAQLVRKMINKLQRSQELKSLTEEDESELKKLQEQEQKLYA